MKYQGFKKKPFQRKFRKFKRKFNKAQTKLISLDEKSWEATANYIKDELEYELAEESSSNSEEPSETSNLKSQRIFREISIR